MENLTVFLTPKGCRKYSQTNYNFATTLIQQDDHLTTGAWAACALSKQVSVELVDMLFVTSCVVLKNNCSFVLTFDGLRYATPVVFQDT